jgi:hypothetical protein
MKNYDDDSLPFKKNLRGPLFGSTPEPHPDGETYDPSKDYVRLKGQNRKVFEIMKDGVWRSLQTIAEEVGCSEASVSARLRDLRKKKFGGFTVDRRRITDPYTKQLVCWQYALELER